MGIILSRVRKKKSTVETLEKLENDIKEIEENRSNAQRKYKKITKLFLIYSMGLYILCGIFFYFYFSSTYREKLLYLVPLALSPFLLYIVKRLISWYYIRLINQNQLRLNDMKKEKKKILDEVMEKETYKVAKEILEKFSSETLAKPDHMQLAPIKPLSRDTLRKRIYAPKPQISNNFNNSPANQPPRPMSPMNNRGLQASGSPKLWMPAPILPLNRTYMDKFVEYLIGDGPNNRYALICSRCHSHNGMALKEEFEYIGYKCCYCYQFNPARKVKPEAPKLESPYKSTQESETDSDSNKTSPESSDTELKAILNSKESNANDGVEAPNTRGDATSVNSANNESCSHTETDQTFEVDTNPVDSAADEKVEENSVKEPSSSNQADDTLCDESLIKT